MRINAVIRGAESWWGCSDFDSGLLIDFDSGSDSDSVSRSDTKYKVNNTNSPSFRSPSEKKKRDIYY